MEKYIRKNDLTIRVGAFEGFYVVGSINGIELLFHKDIEKVSDENISDGAVRMNFKCYDAVMAKVNKLAERPENTYTMEKVIKKTMPVEFAQVLADVVTEFLNDNYKTCLDLSGFSVVKETANRDANRDAKNEKIRDKIMSIKDETRRKKAIEKHFENRLEKQFYVF